MGTVFADITLKNVKDIHKADIGLITDDEIRQSTAKAIADTGAISLVINEELQQELGLEITGEREATFANNTKEMVKIAGLVEVHWKNRSMVCHPLVASANGPVLLGAIPLEGMDLIVDPVRQELTGAHGDEIVYFL